MLQGTFETLSLPEVLGLLASARKSGALRLEAGPVSGVVHIEDGYCRAVETVEQRTPVGSGSALLARLVDVCFAVTRQESGAFRFADDEAAPWLSDEPVELSDALVEVDRLLKQWREILRVIPSLDCCPRLLTELEADEIVVDREHWALLVSIDGRRSVRELVQRAARPVLEVCHALLELVEAGAIGIVDPAAAHEAAPAVQTPAVQTPAVQTPAVQTPAVQTPAVQTPAVQSPVVPPVVTPPVTPPTPAPVTPAAPPVAEVETPTPAAPTPAAPTPAAPTPAAPTPAGADPKPAPLAIVREAAPAGAQDRADSEPPEPDDIEPESERASGDEGGSAPDKGTFLRLFSGLRDG